MKNFSLIIETENIKNESFDCAFDRLFYTLEELKKSIWLKKLDKVVVVLDESLNFVPKEIITVEIDWVVCSGNYYQKKNFGAKYCQSEILLFIDSDISYSSNYFDQILSPHFEFPYADLTYGLTLANPNGNLWEKASILSWTYGVEGVHDNWVNRPGRFFANSFAIRRELYLMHPIPDQNNARIWCYQWFERFQKIENLKILYLPEAKAFHPMPNTAIKFFSRAYKAGRDRYFAHYYGFKYVHVPLLLKALWYLQYSLPRNYIRFIKSIFKVEKNPLNLFSLLILSTGFWSVEQGALFLNTVKRPKNTD